MKVIWSDAQLAHDPQFYLIRGKVTSSYEVAGRAKTLLAACQQMGLTIADAPVAPREALERVHRPDYIDFLQHAAAEWRAEGGTELLPTMYPTPEMLQDGTTIPQGVLGRAGWYVVGIGAPISEHTWTSVAAAADCAVEAARQVSSGVPIAYALTRPPGHHAYPARAGGHCFLNNAAIAAEELRAGGARKVGILDLDVHHGNGMQHIFYHRPDVSTVSIHGDPNYQYPWFVGHADERGSGAGDGHNLNIPLGRDICDDEWIAAISRGLEALQSSDVLVVALGFDTSVHEPLGFFGVSDDAYARAGALLAKARKPLVIVQEGGYCVDVLGRLLTNFVMGLKS